MRLTTLELANFGKLRDVSIEVPPPPFHTRLHGENDEGKSTVAGPAISWALTGKGRGLDAGGRGAASLIRKGEKEAIVRLHIEGVGIVTRKVTERGQTLEIAKSATDKTSGPLPKVQAILLDRLGVPEGVIMACLNGESLLSLHHSDAKALLLGVLNVRVRLHALGAETVDLTLDELDARYKEAYTARTGAKARLQAVRLLPVGLPPEDVSSVNLEALEGKLSKLRNDEKDWVEQRGQTAGKREVLLDRRGVLVGQLATLQEQSAATLRQRQVATKEDESPTVTLVGYLAGYLSAKQAEFRGLSEESGVESKAKTTLADASGRLTLLESTITQVEQHDPERGCVLSQDIPCKTAPTHFQKQIKGLKQQVKDLTAAKEESERLLTDLRARQDRRTVVEQAIKTAERELATVMHAGTHSDEIEAAIAQVDTDLAVLADQPGDPYGFDVALTTVRQRIQDGEQKITTLRRMQQDWASYQKTKADQDLAQREVTQLDALCEQLGPNGVRVQALSKALGTFEASINSALTPYGYTLAFQVEPTFAVFVNGIESTMLATSVRWRVGVAFAMALAEISGFNFVAIDGVDILSGPNRKTFQAVLAQFPGQALVAQTKDPGTDPEVVPPGYAVYRLEDGISKRIGEAVAA